jgi:molybdate transport system substrate-binding protein
LKRADEIIVFDLTGTGRQDVAAAAAVYRRALEQRAGLPFYSDYQENDMQSKTFIACLAATVAVAPLPGRAGEISLLSAASMQTVFKEVIGDFERASGHKVNIRYSTMGAITGRVAGGESADLVISSQASISSLVAQGKIASGSELLIAKTGVGAVVPAGDPVPRIESGEDFRRALLDARIVLYADPAGGGAAGIHIARLIEKLGLAEQVKPKTKFGAGGDVAELTIAQGPGALGLTQVSEIVGKPGMQFVPVPEELQNYTGFVAGVPAGAKSSEAVGALVAFLKTPAAIAVMKARGMKVD